MERILFVTEGGLENGGIQAVIMSIVRQLHHKYIFDIIVRNSGRHYYSEEFESYGGYIYCFPPKIKIQKIDKYLYPFYMEKEFNKFLNEHGPFQAIHCHNYFDAGIYVKLAAKHNISIRITHCHNVASSQRRKNPLWLIYKPICQSWIKRYSTNLIGCSRGACQYLFDKASAKVINNAIDLDKFSLSKYEVKDHDGFRFVNVGRYCYQKNQEFAIDVFDKVAAVQPKAELFLVGFGVNEEMLNKKVQVSPYADKIKMLPHDSDVAKVYAESDYVLFPSRYEGLGISLIEAQAMGLTCFCSDVIQPEADCGLCVKISLSEGAELWAKKIIKYIKVKGKKKRQVNMQRFDINLIINEYLDLYDGRGG